MTSNRMIVANSRDLLPILRQLLDLTRPWTTAEKALLLRALGMRLEELPR